jgi:hypothetical protein
MTGMMRVPRSRGALSGVLLVLLGAWGGLIPFIGPNFHYAYTPDTAWSYTSGRLVLEVLPGAAALLGGLVLLASRVRPVAMLGGWLAVLSGAWFAVGGIVSVLWTTGGGTAAGTPVGGTAARVAEQIGFFTGLGVVIVLLAALALGRLAVVGVRDSRIAAREREVPAEEVPAPAAAGSPVTAGAGSASPAAAGTRAAETRAAEAHTQGGGETRDVTEAPRDAQAPGDASAPRKAGLTS